MKRFKFVIVMLLLIFTLSGCVQEYKPTDEQNDALAEYMAGLLLKYDDNYDQELVTTDEVTDDGMNFVTQAPASTTSSEGSSSGAVSDSSSNGSADTGKNYPLTEVIGNSNFEFNFKDYKIVDTYPENTENTYFTLSPREGYQLLVVSFSVKNVTGSTQKLDMGDENINYKLSINSDTEYKTLLTFLENDLQYIDVSVGSGKSKTALLVFEISKNQNISNIELVASKDNKSSKIEVK